MHLIVTIFFSIDDEANFTKENTVRQEGSQYCLTADGCIDETI